jgi:hypothetical protein
MFSTAHFRQTRFPPLPFQPTGFSYRAFPIDRFHSNRVASLPSFFRQGFLPSHPTCSVSYCALPSDRFSSLALPSGFSPSPYIEQGFPRLFITDRVSSLAIYQTGFSTAHFRQTSLPPSPFQLTGFLLWCLSD